MMKNQSNNFPTEALSRQSRDRRCFAISVSRCFVASWLPMRIAYLECFSGISGDMFLGALVDAGVSPQVFHEAVAALGVGAKLEISRVIRSGISATKVDVWADGEKDLPREEYWQKQGLAQAPSSAKPHHHHYAHGHSHAHDGEHDAHGDSHEQHRPDRGSTPAPHKHEHSHRGLAEIRQIISAAKIPETAKNTAIRIFEALGAAE